MPRRAKGEGCLCKPNKKCKIWYAQFYDASGRQVRISTGTAIKAEALAELRRLMGKSESGKDVKPSKLTYADIRAGLLSNYVERGNKSLRVLADGSEAIVGLRQLDTFCGYTPENPGIAVVKITTDFAREFARVRIAEGVGPAMVNRSLQCLRRMLNIAREDGKLGTVPKIRLLKEPPARKGFLEREKFEELLAALPPHLRPLILFLYWCGVRKGEAVQIEWPQVDLKAGLIRLEEEQTKSGDPRVVPIPDVLIAVLASVKDKAGRVFSATNLRTEWERACASVGLGTLENKKSANGWNYQKYEGLIVHDLRRSAIRNLRKAQVSEGVAMKISGHKTRAVFERYNIVSTDDVQAAMRAVENSAAPISAKTVQSAPRTQRKSLKA